MLAERLHPLFFPGQALRTVQSRLAKLWQPQLRLSDVIESSARRVVRGPGDRPHQRPA